MMKTRALITLATCFLLSASAFSQPAGSGPGMMSGGQGMGPGMMGGQGMSPGMMGGYGMGSGMMGGYGMGPGMMGGYGMGPGMMGGYGAGAWGPDIPDLTSEQRTKIAAAQKEFRQKQWALMEKMHEDSLSGNTSRGGKFDEQAARKAYDATAAIHKQMFENSLEAHKRIDGILTPQQREQLQRSGSGR